MGFRGAHVEKHPAADQKFECEHSSISGGFRSGIQTKCIPHTDLSPTFGCQAGRKPCKGIFAVTFVVMNAMHPLHSKNSRCIEKEGRLGEEGPLDSTRFPDAAGNMPPAQKILQNIINHPCLTALIVLPFDAGTLSVNWAEMGLSEIEVALEKL